MSVDKEETPKYASKWEIESLERRLTDARNERDKIKKSIKTIVAVLVDKKIIGEAVAKAFMESKEEIEEAKKLWIKGAIKRKGALRGTLGIKEGETIPVSILNKIKNAETGTKVSFRGKSITVTSRLKRQAILALRLRAMPKRGHKK